MPLFEGFTMPSSGFFVVAEESFSIGIADKTEDLPFNDFNNKTYLHDNKYYNDDYNIDYN